jgi:hypothetical protein
MESAYSAVRTGALNQAVCASLPRKQWNLACSRRSFLPRREIVSVSTIPVIVMVSVTEPSDAINAGMATQTEGRPQLFLWLVIGSF